jgi:putative CocE/NonD family hydrolase
MSDGTVLRVDVSFPTDLRTRRAASGHFPVILTQTPYGKSSGSAAPSALAAGASTYLVSRGYIQVVADIRGTGDSGGTFGLFDPVQATDGAALVRWAAALPNSDGQVGTLGPSYLGIIQLLTAAAMGPNSPLKTIFPIIAANDVYRDTAFDGGIADFEFGNAFLGLTAGLNALNPVVENPQDTAGLVNTEIQHLSGLSAFQLNDFESITTGGDLAYDEAYWQARSPRQILDQVVKNGITAFLVGGWYDLFQRGEPLNYSGLQNAFLGRPVSAPMLPKQRVTGRYQLLMGPWYHINAGEGIDMNRLELEWFDTWLKGEATGMAESQTPLHLYQLGTGQWLDTSRYPMNEAVPTTFYLSDAGRLTTAQPTASKGADVVIVAPPSPCNRSTDQWGAGGTALVFGPSDPCAGNDITTQLPLSAVTYTTPAFSQPTVVAGPIDVSLFATSTRPESEWVATIEDVSPDGRSDPLTSGALLGSFRALDKANTWTAPNGRPMLPYHPFTRASSQPVSPGQLTRYDIEVFPTFAELAAGHRLRLTITTADLPHLLPDAQAGPTLLGGVYTVGRNSTAPSFIELPLAPAAAFRSPCAICRR